MKNVIWSIDELKEIRKIVLTRANLKLDENNELVTASKFRTYDAYGYSDKSIYLGIGKELENLIYSQEREKIKNALKQASSIKEKNNIDKSIGFNHILSQINPENHYEIFIIFKEILAQYEHQNHFVAQKAVDKYSNLDDARERVKNIVLSEEESIEVTIAKLLIDKTLADSKEFIDNDLFNPLIEKLNNMQKERLVIHMNHIIAGKSRYEYTKKKNENYEYLNSTKRKIRKF